MIQAYWSRVVAQLNNIFGLDLELDPLSLLLGFPCKLISNKFERRLFSLLTFAARKNLLMSWISDRPPSIKGWHSVIREIIPLELLTCIIHSTTDAFNRIWTPYLNCINASTCDILRFGMT